MAERGTVRAGTPSAPRSHLVRPGAARPARTRLHALDALRVSAMLLVVSLHAALAYTQGNVPRLLWGVHDPAGQPGFDLFCWWAMGVSLPLFFTMAGFFAADLHDQLGPTGFVKNRVRRLFVPSVGAGLIVLPLTLYAWAYGWLVTGRCTLREILRLKFHGPGMDALYGPAHLWFLEYLVCMLVAFWAVRRLWPARRAGALVSRLLTARWGPLVLAVPTAAILWVSRERVGLDVALDRHNTFAIDPIRLLHHGLFFAVGVRLQAFRDDLGRFRSPALLYLALAVPVFAARAYLLPRDWAHPLAGAPALLLVVLGGLFAWLIVFGFLGAALLWFDRPRPAVRYLADSSFWMYLCHFPIVGLVQADLFRLAWPAGVKCAVVWSLTMALGLSSYQVLVRHTVVGFWLSGARRRPADPSVLAGPRRTVRAAASGQRV